MATFAPPRVSEASAERYTPADLEENPTLADMTRSALSVLSAKPGQPFALFVEAGDVDFALHDNNLDNAIGALYDGEKAIDVIFDWIRQHSNWDESVVIVTADHGHYFVLDDPSRTCSSAPRSVRRLRLAVWAGSTVNPGTDATTVPASGATRADRPGRSLPTHAPGSAARTSL